MSRRKPRVKRDFPLLARVKILENRACHTLFQPINIRVYQVADNPQIFPVRAVGEFLFLKLELSRCPLGAAFYQLEHISRALADSVGFPLVKVIEKRVCVVENPRFEALAVLIYINKRKILFRAAFVDYLGEFGFRFRFLKKVAEAPFLFIGQIGANRVRVACRIKRALSRKNRRNSLQNRGKRLCNPLGFPLDKR